MDGKCKRRRQGIQAVNSSSDNSYCISQDNIITNGTSLNFNIGEKNCLEVKNNQIISSMGMSADITTSDNSFINFTQNTVGEVIFVLKTRGKVVLINNLSSDTVTLCAEELAVKALRNISTHPGNSYEFLNLSISPENFKVEVPAEQLNLDGFKSQNMVDDIDEFAGMSGVEYVPLGSEIQTIPKCFCD